MIHLGGLVERLRREDGGILLAFALILPGVLLLSALALEIGNWYEHRRHLQTQTDAAALAAGTLFRGCANTPDATLTAMIAMAAQYGGDTATLNAVDPATSPRNLQVGSNGPMAGNLPKFSYQGTAYPPDYTSVADTDPCTSGAFDVRATEDSIPHIFGISPLATVHAHSRVEMKAVDQLKGLLPVAVPDVRPKYVFATFVDSSGQPIAGCPSGCTEQLVKGSTVGDQQTWVPDTDDPLLAVPIPQGGASVRIKLIGADDPTLDCGELYTQCYDAGSPNGIVNIRGWDGSATAPRVENAYLLTGDCSPDAYYAITDCSAGLQAAIDLGDHPLSGNGASATVTAAAGDGSVDLTPGSGTTGVVTWTATGGLQLSGPGLHDVSLSWTWEQTSGTWRGNTCTTRGNNPCTDSGSFTNVQRAYLASSDSGPIYLAQVYEQGVNTFGANSFEAGGTHTLGVTIRTTGALLLSQPTDPPIALRVKGSQNQTINCDPSGNTRDEIQFGCSPYFIKNPSLQCPPANQIWDLLPAPLPCVIVEPGGEVGQINQGLNLRIYGEINPSPGQCEDHPVNWIPGQGFDEDAHADDKRVLPLIVTPLGTFQGTGITDVPVIDFGYFYVTGYYGDPCDGVDPNDDPVPDKSFIEGHFIKFFPLEKLIPSDDECDLTSITPCVSVLTR